MIRWKSYIFKGEILKCFFEVLFFILIIRKRLVVSIFLNRGMLIGLGRFYRKGWFGEGICVGFGVVEEFRGFLGFWFL